MTIRLMEWAARRVHRTECTPKPQDLWMLWSRAISAPPDFCGQELPADGLRERFYDSFRLILKQAGASREGAWVEAKVQSSAQTIDSITVPCTSVRRSFRPWCMKLSAS